MPETDETLSLEQQYEQELADGQVRLGHLFDRGVRELRSPIEILGEESNNFEGMRQLYGAAVVDEAVKHFPEVPLDDRDGFISAVIELIKPMIRSGFFDPEVRARVEEYRRQHTSERILTAPVDQPHLEMNIHRTDIKTQIKSKQPDGSFSFDITLPDGTELKQGDVVMEISWPNQGPGPKGMKGMIAALRVMAETMQARPEIKALTILSWMVSRDDIMEKLGFHTMPEVVIDESQISNVVDWAHSGREGKPYDREVQRGDVKFAALSRDEFLARYQRAGE